MQVISRCRQRKISWNTIFGTSKEVKDGKGDCQGDPASTRQGTRW